MFPISSSLSLKTSGRSSVVVQRSKSESNYDERDQPSGESECLNGLIKAGILTRIRKIQDVEYKFRKKKFTSGEFQFFNATRVVLVTNDGVHNAKDWSFKATLWRIGGSSPRCYYEFVYTLEQLRKIAEHLYQNRLQGIFYFPDKSYPKRPKIDGFRLNEIQNIMDKESALLKEPTFPKIGPGIFWGKKAKDQDAESACTYLSSLFTSFSLCSESWFYGCLNFKSGLAYYLKLVARGKAESLLSTAKLPFISPIRLAMQKLDPSESNSQQLYDFMYVVKRPLDPRFKLPIFSHWAVKFEGDNHLLTIGFFSRSGTKRGCVQVRQTDNNTTTRKIFWYWWQKEESETLEDDQNWFMKRWNVIDYCRFLEPVSSECIGRMIIGWMCHGNNGLYSLVENNCQHFVRDIVAALNSRISLNHCLDVSLAKDIIPMNRFVQQARTNNIRKVLKDEIKDYQRDIAQRRRQFAQNSCKCSIPTLNEENEYWRGKIGDGQLFDQVSTSGFPLICEDEKARIVIDSDNDNDVIEECEESTEKNGKSGKEEMEEEEEEEEEEKAHERSNSTKDKVVSITNISTCTQNTISFQINNYVGATETVFNSDKQNTKAEKQTDTNLA